MRLPRARWLARFAQALLATLTCLPPRHALEVAETAWPHMGDEEPEEAARLHLLRAFESPRQAKAATVRLAATELLA